MTNRIPPPDSESNRTLSAEQKRKAAQKIEKVREVDPDEEAKQQRFLQIMRTEDEEDEIEKSENQQYQQPSPFETTFHLAQSKDQDPSNLGLNATPSPSYSTPPDLTDLSPTSEDLLSDQGLPQSQDFWNQADLPDQPLDQNPQLTAEQPITQQPLSKTTPDKQGGQKETQKQSAKPEKKLDPSPFGIPGKPAPAKGATSQAPPPFVKKKAEEEAPTAKYWTEQPELVQGTPGTQKDKERTAAKGARPGKTPEEQKSQMAPKDFAPVLKRAEDSHGGGHGGQGSKKRGQQTIEIVPPAMPGLPSSVQSTAGTAATAATPYLRPETIPLFYQMVGTILVMTNQGVSTTEILLNNPAFAGSKFFGSSIEIIKYSTAPDSLNIRLSGSNEAVTAFNQDIPGLMAAFQTGGFRFRIGRIDAVYAADKPIFHRKEGKGKGDTLGDESPGKGG